MSASTFRITRPSRARRAKLEVYLARWAKSGPIDLIIDSSDLAIVGEGQWAAAKRGGKRRRGWKKLHLGVDATGEIVAQILTDINVHDGATAVAIIGGAGGPIRSVTADAAYESKPV